MKILKNKFVTSAVLICVLLFVGNYIYQADLWLETVEPHKIINIDNIRTINEKQESILQDLDGKKVIFYFQLRDFTCTACTKNFLNYSDNISKNVEKWNKQTLFLTSRNNMPLRKQHERLKIWASANYINDEIEILISEDFKDKFDIQKSAFLVSMDRNNYQVFYLPLKPSERKYIDSKLNM